MSTLGHGAVGPHEGRELELMRAGSKPLSMFVEPYPSDGHYFAEGEFDKLFSQGKLIKRERIESILDHAGRENHIRRVLYALPGEEWRINAMELVQDIYASLAPGWKQDLERVIGLLLGYNRGDIETFLAEKLK